MPRLSIIIPTLNRGKLLHDTVNQLLCQAHRDFELWVIDQSDPGQRAENEAFFRQCLDSRLHVLFLSVKGLPNARNEGLARISGEVVLFLDDDVILLGPEFLTAHLAPYEDPTVGGVVGRIVERSVRPNAPDTASHLSWGGRTITNLWGTQARDLPTLKGANMSYRMAAVRQVGGFDRRYVGTALLEDSDYSTRVAAAGWRLRFEPAAELVHLSAPSGGVRVEDQLRTECSRFRATAYFMLKHRGSVGFAAFSATYAAIALKRIKEWRQPGAAAALWRAVQDGVEAWRAGPDESLPKLPPDGTLPASEAACPPPRH